MIEDIITKYAKLFELVTTLVAFVFITFRIPITDSHVVVVPNLNNSKIHMVFSKKIPRIYGGYNFEFDQDSSYKKEHVALYQSDELRDMHKLSKFITILQHHMFSMASSG